MKNIRLRVWANTLLLFLGMEAWAQVRAEQYFAHSLPDNSVVYALPRTLLSAVVTVEEVEEQPGPLALYAQHYLGRKEAILQPRKAYRLGGVRLEPYGVPDEGRRFSVKFRKNSSATYVTLTPSGLLTGINHPASEEFPPFTSETKLLQAPLEGRGISPLPPEYIQALTVAKKAEIAAEELYRIRESRGRVVSGDTEQPFTDGDALRLALARLDEAEQYITELFMGRRWLRSTEHLVEGLEPMVRSEQQVAFRFSEQEGLLPANDLRGEPIYLDITIMEQAPELDERTQSRKERSLRKGIIYVVPGRVRASLTYKGKVLYTTEVAVAQLGALESLDEALFTARDKRTAISFHTSNGAIAEVKEVNP